MKQLGTELSWNGRFWDHCKVYVVSWLKADACGNTVCMLLVSWSYSEFSWVSQWRWREQRSWRYSELWVANRSEGDIMKKGWSCLWLAWLRWWSCLSCCVHVLSSVTWNIQLGVVIWVHADMVRFGCHGTWWEPGKKLRRNLSLTNLKIFQEIWCHDCRNIALSMSWYENWTGYITPSRSLGWIRRWKGDSESLCRS